MSPTKLEARAQRSLTLSLPRVHSIPLLRASRGYLRIRLRDRGLPRGSAGSAVAHEQAHCRWGRFEARNTMAFTGAPVSKGLVIGLGTCTILAAVTARQHLFSIPLSPHLTRDWQLWRLPAHHLVFANSSEMFIATLILVYTSVAIERNMGTLKYAVRFKTRAHVCANYTN